MAPRFITTRSTTKARSRSLVLLLPLVGLVACTSEEQKILEQGQAIYTGMCKVCHAQGINGAPILGNKKMWAKRADQGLPTLVQHASQGFGLMPAKGGNENLTEAEISSAVQFMLSQLK